MYQSYKEKCLYEDSEECKTIVHSIESSFLNTGSDIKNVYNQCVQQEAEMPCFDLIGIKSFLNDPDVKKEIHADPSVEWKMCNFNIQ